ncbi:MAG TPA: type II secretion system protein GspG [Longimicrobiales bacterium]|nr:type II secretion system protein GspG [Longimicrobiales bacterium]
MGKLIFIIIVVLGAGMAIPSTRAMMETQAAPVINRVKAKVVPGRLDAMADQLEVRLGRGEKYPNNWPGWLEREYTSSAEDPWGNLYFLEIGRNDFTVGSMGPDGKQGTPDDIELTRRLKKN